ncbi:unnamed protein product [Chondrus crispus]|uniref:Uncharacterized protein n=1 Tax=Chondrus crispus TaxID=2769 RepID=R7Q4G2_CHOCR|nr:unnamed protein product [Chondrus crispus]CDF32899.1 unnamed protein product [Chondrus crispus]|eukprot:XP_005712700.1 unnamed protein product [Chondrus crispus]
MSCITTQTSHPFLTLHSAGLSWSCIRCLTITTRLFLVNHVLLRSGSLPTPVSKPLRVQTVTVFAKMKLCLVDSIFTKQDEQGGGPDKLPQ